jgi:hypothetical protein
MIDKFDLTKQLKKKTLTVIFTAIIATVFFIILLFSLPKIEKFSVKLISSKYFAPEIVHYCDLDSDGKSEMIRFNKNFDGVSAYIVEKQGKIFYQHNFTDQYIEGKFYCTGDYNNDLLKEIYVFTEH